MTFDKKAWRLTNKYKIKKHNKTYRDTHKEELKEYNKNYIEKNKKILLIKWRMHYENNKEQILQKSKDTYKSIRKTIKKWSSKREMKLYHNRKYRANNAQIVEDFTFSDWMQKLKSTNGTCPKCNEHVGIERLTLDHIYPMSKAEPGKVYNINDVQPLCRKCNSSKKDKIGDI